MVTTQQTKTATKTTTHAAKPAPAPAAPATTKQKTPIAQREALILATLNKRISASVRRIDKWSREGGYVDPALAGVKDAEAGLKRAVDALLEVPAGWSHIDKKASAAGGAALNPGQKVAIREKYHAEFDILEESDRKGLTVKAQRGSRVLCTNDKGMTLLFERRVLEVAS